MNQETRDSTIEAISAVKKLSIANPGTSIEAPQKSKTLMMMAAMPKVRIEMGRAIS